MREDLELYFRQVFGIWLVVSGAIVRVLAALSAHLAHSKHWEHVETFIKKHLHLKNISFACILIASYVAWLTEHHSAVSYSNQLQSEQGINSHLTQQLENCSNKPPLPQPCKLEIPGTKPQLVFEEARLFNLDMPATYKGSPLLVDHQITVRFTLKNVGPVAASRLKIGSLIQLSPIMNAQQEEAFFNRAADKMREMPSENVSIPSQRGQFFDAWTDERMDQKTLDELTGNLKLLYIAVAATYFDKETGISIPLSVCGFYNVNEMDLGLEHRGHIETLHQCKTGRND